MVAQFGASLNRRPGTDQVLNKYCLSKAYIILSGLVPIPEIGIHPRIRIRGKIPTAWNRGKGTGLEMGRGSPDVASGGPGVSAQSSQCWGAPVWKREAIHGQSWVVYTGRKCQGLRAVTSSH